MPWVRLDDHFDENPKIAAAGDGAFRLWVNALAYANRTLSDGFIPATMIRRLSTAHKPEKDAGELVRLGLWESVDGGWLIHDYGEYQPTAEHVRDVREKRRAAGSLGGKQRAANAEGKQDAKQIANQDAEQDAEQTASKTQPRTRTRSQSPNNGAVASGESEHEQSNRLRSNGVAESPGAHAREGQHFSSSSSGSKSAQTLQGQGRESATGTGQKPAENKVPCVPKSRDRDNHGAKSPALSAESREQFDRACRRYHNVWPGDPMPDVTGALGAWQRVAPRYVGQGATPEELWAAINAWDAHWDAAEAERPDFAAWLADGLDREPPATAHQGATP